MISCLASSFVSLFIFFSFLGFFFNLYLYFHSTVSLLFGPDVLALNVGGKNKEIKEGSAKENVVLTFFPFTITLLLLHF